MYRLRDHLGISEDDAIWSIFVALQLHLKLYKQIPDAIRKETQRTIEQIHIPIFDAQKKAVKEIKEFKEQNTEEMVTVAKREAVGVGIQIGEKISALAYEANKLFKDASDDHQKHMNEALELHTKNLAEANDVYKEAITKLTKQTSNHLYAWVLKAAFQIFMLVFGVMTGVLLVNQFPGVLNFLKLLQI